MSYTFVAVSCYIIMRGFQVLFEDRLKDPESYSRVVLKIVTAIMIYAAIASIITFYKQIPLLGFDPKN